MDKSRTFRLARALIVPIVIVIGIALAGSIIGALLRGRKDNTLAGGGPNATALHLRATRNDDVTGRARTTQIEAWFDTATGEGKLVERVPDGSLLSVVSLANGTQTTYLGDAHHAIIRRNVKANSGSADRLRFDLFRYTEAVKRGGGQVVGQGKIGTITTDRIRIEIEGTVIVADVDPATGLALREEFTPSGDKSYLRETSYDLIEWVGRASLPADTWRVDLPPGTGLEEYNDGPTGRIDSGELAAVPYSVYGPANEGQPVAAFRRNSAVPGGPSSDAYYLIYQTTDGEVQCISALPPDPAFQSAQKPPTQQRPSTVQIGGTSWTLATSGPGVQGSASLAGTLVTITAPNQAVFERVAGSLQRLNR